MEKYAVATIAWQISLPICPTTTLTYCRPAPAPGKPGRGDQHDRRAGVHHGGPDACSREKRRRTRPYLALVGGHRVELRARALCYRAAALLPARHRLQRTRSQRGQESGDAAGQGKESPGLRVDPRHRPRQPHRRSRSALGLSRSCSIRPAAGHRARAGSRRDRTRVAGAGATRERAKAKARPPTAQSPFGGGSSPSCAADRPAPAGV